MKFYNHKQSSHKSTRCALETT